MLSSHLSKSLFSWRQLASPWNPNIGDLSVPTATESCASEKDKEGGCSEARVKRIEREKNNSSVSNENDDIEKASHTTAAYQHYMCLRDVCDAVLIHDFLYDSMYFEVVIQSYDLHLHESPHGSQAIVLTQMVPVRHLLGSQDLHRVEFIVPQMYNNAHHIKRNVSLTLWGKFKITYGGHSQSLRILPNQKEDLKELLSQYDVWFENENKAVPLNVVFRKNKTVESVSFELDMEKFPTTLAALQRKDLSSKRYIVCDAITSATQCALAQSKNRVKL